MERTKLIEAREKRGWTQAQAARKLGVDAVTLCRWEQGKATPRGYNKKRLLDVYGISEALLEGEKKQSKQTDSIQRIAFVSDDLTMKLLSLAFLPHRSYQDVQKHLVSILEGDTMNDDPMSRRNALRRLATLPLITFYPGTAELPVVRSSEEVLTQCAASIAACWQLSKGKDGADLELAFKGVSLYAPLLKDVVKHASKIQQRKEAASLAAQCDLLKMILGWHIEGLHALASYAREALLYSEEAGDIPLQIAGHVQVSWMYYYTCQYQQSLREADLAAHLLKTSVIPLPANLHSGVHSTRAIRQAMYNKDQEALTSLRLAHHHFAEVQPDTQQIVYIDFFRSSLILEDGMAYAQLGRYDIAFNSFEQIVDPQSLTTKIPVAERVRVEVLNNQVLALLKSKQRDMDQAIRLWKAGIQGAIALRSEQRFNEACTAYEVMLGLWPGEKRIKDLRALIAHW
jgi:transcriptional regulator with XRE-family HTH domain/tetratricopeptide (TPR) repeat protein